MFGCAKGSGWGRTGKRKKEKEKKAKELQEARVLGQ